MPNIKLYTGNRLEILADRLAGLVSKPLSSPFKQEAIVVQSKGMERWISMRLAERLGIWSNCRYYFPNEIINKIIRSGEGDETGKRIFDKDINTWRIIKLLREFSGEAGFEEVKDYIAGDTGGFRTFQLSSIIADNFDQYLTYRPEMILGWDDWKDDGWQAVLWRALMGEVSLVHPPALRDIFFRNMESKNLPALGLESLPERIILFGISGLPLFHKEVLDALSDFIEVDIFFMNPCEEYWPDIFTEKRIAGTMAAYDDLFTAAGLHLETGNSLLASMGRMGADFLSILYENEQEEFTFFADPGNDTLLHAIQSDILHLLGPEQSGNPAMFNAERIKSDRSIMIHSCHSPMREAEVLYDNLLDIFSADPDIEPRDVIVMVPDIKKYSPYIHAVFDSPYSECSRIPFSIADRDAGGESVLIEIFFAVLDLREKRFSAEAVMGILECPEILAKFELQASDPDLVRKWVKDTAVIWGINADDRSSMGLPSFRENTWKAGMERMLLGYAMPGDELFSRMLPYNEIEGGDAAVLGKFLSFVKTLAVMTDALSGDHQLIDWANILKDIFEKLFRAGDDGYGELLVRAFAGLPELQKESDFGGCVGLNVIRAWLEEQISSSRTKTRFLTGGVTFCELLPMRSIPFAVVCLLGMDDSSFPRADSKVSFDLISADPKRGDRSRRGDDRYIFLESIISARKTLYISYVGQDIKDNSIRPPSVVVSSLQDYINKYNPEFINHICVKHPLQSFSRKYFSGGSLFSYSARNCEAAEASAGEREEEGAFITEKFPEEPVKAVSIDELAAFFLHPVRYFLNRRLGIYLRDIDESFEESEPFSITGLVRYKLEDNICFYLMQGRDPEELYRIKKAEGVLPHGPLGEIEFRNIIAGLKKFTGRINEVAGGWVDPVDINLNISGISLTGRINGISKNGMVVYSSAKMKAKYRLSSWIRHLALNSQKAERKGKSFLICRDEEWELSAVPESDEILSGLISIYRKGLAEPLPFFPESSFVYASGIIEGASGGEAIFRADGKWEDGWNGIKGEGSDLYNKLCFRNDKPFGREFTALSLNIFGDMLKERKDDGR